VGWPRQVSPLFLTAVLGCSASRHIAVEANTISERAEKISDLADQIGNTSQEVESIRSAASIQLEARKIRQSVAEIHNTLPGVKDITPWWADLIRWLLIASAGAALVWLLYATGAVSVIRVAIGWIPRRKINEAEMAAATLATDRPETLREWIAMKRASDKEFDAAWSKAKGTIGVGAGGDYPAGKEPPSAT
jgi:hypothetical protein